jgi:riboflavin synthase
MFTGIVQSVGTIAAVEPRGEDRRLRVRAGGLDLARAHLGDSIAVSGACLTVVDLDRDAFAADVSNETLACTTLGTLAAGDRVNLEPALTPATPLGGHLVSGHVDGVGELLAREQDARSMRMRLRVPAELSRYVARKGSVCIDGVSLTVNDVDGDTFGVNLVPHTLEHTTLGDFAPGRLVNVEVDLLARYVERLLEGTPGR